MYLWLANLIAVLHALLLTCLVASTVAAVCGCTRGRPRIIPAFLVAAGLAAGSQLLFQTCLLTAWEVALRNRHTAGSGYDGGFVHHYLPFLPPLAQQYGVTALFLVIVASLFAWNFADRRKS